MLVDWARVRELQGEIGDDGFADVVQLFLTESDGVIAQIATNRRASDDELHFLRGAALNLGFTDLAICCQPGADMARLASLYADSKAALLAMA